MSNFSQKNLHRTISLVSQGELEQLEDIVGQDEFSIEEDLGEYLVDTIQDNVELHVEKVARGDYSTIDEFDYSDCALYDILIYRHPVSLCVSLDTRIRMYRETVEELKKDQDEESKAYAAATFQKEIEDYARLYLKFKGRSPEEAANGRK